MLQFSISYLFNQSLDTLLPAALRSLNLASKRLEAKGYLSVRWDLFLAILLLCFIGFASAVFFFVLFIVSSARILPLFSSHFISSDLVTPCCLTTVLYWFVDNFSESKRSGFFLWIRWFRTFACYFPFECCFAFEFDLAQHRPIHVAHPKAVDSLPLCACLFYLSQCFYRCWNIAVRVLCGRGRVLELYVAVQILLNFERSVAVFAFNCGADQFNCLFQCRRNVVHSAILQLYWFS